MKILNEELVKLQLLKEEIITLCSKMKNATHPSLDILVQEHKKRTKSIYEKKLLNQHAIEQKKLEIAQQCELKFFTEWKLGDYDISFQEYLKNKEIPITSEIIDRLEKANVHYDEDLDEKEKDFIFNKNIILYETKNFKQSIEEKKNKIEDIDNDIKKIIKQMNEANENLEQKGDAIKENFEINLAKLDIKRIMLLFNNWQQLRKKFKISFDEFKSSNLYKSLNDETLQEINKIKNDVDEIINEDVKNLKVEKDNNLNIIQNDFFEIEHELIKVTKEINSKIIIISKEIEDEYNNKFINKKNMIFFDNNCLHIGDNLQEKPHLNVVKKVSENSFNLTHDLLGINLEKSEDLNQYSRHSENLEFSLKPTQSLLVPSKDNSSDIPPISDFQKNFYSNFMAQENKKTTKNNTVLQFNSEDQDNVGDLKKSNSNNMYFFKSYETKLSQEDCKIAAEFDKPISDTSSNKNNKFYGITFNKICEIIKNNSGKKRGLRKSFSFRRLAENLHVDRTVLKKKLSEIIINNKSAFDIIKEFIIIQDNAISNQFGDLYNKNLGQLFEENSRNKIDNLTKEDVLKAFSSTKWNGKNKEIMKIVSYQLGIFEEHLPICLNKHNISDKKIQETILEAKITNKRHYSLATTVPANRQPKEIPLNEIHEAILNKVTNPNLKNKEIYKTLKVNEGSFIKSIRKKGIYDVLSKLSISEAESKLGKQYYEALGMIDEKFLLNIKPDNALPPQIIREEEEVIQKKFCKAN